MKAVIRNEYGGPEVLRVEEIEQPVPNPDQVLVKVQASSNNAVKVNHTSQVFKTCEVFFKY
jgi:NADPH:quinone reductase-like Zn-dependent oxidoreductase